MSGWFPSDPNKITKHFQQWMSWLPQRWRTQRNAIRHANCKIQWVIKTLNAPCTSSEVCLLECLSLPTQKPARDFVSRLLAKRIYSGWVCWDEGVMPSENAPFASTRKSVSFIPKDDATSCKSEPTHCLIEHGYDRCFVNTQLGPPISQEYPLNLSI